MAILATSGPALPILITVMRITLASIETTLPPHSTLLGGLVSRSAAKQINTRSGYLDITNSTLHHIGFSISMWSRTVTLESISTNYLNINQLYLSPSYYNSRWYGFPVQCLSV